MATNLTNNISTREAAAPISASSSIDTNTDRIDMANWEGVRFTTSITDSVDTGVATLTVEENTTDSDSGMAALTGAVATVTSGANDDLNGTLLIVDVYRPREQFVQGVLTSGTANIAFGTTTVELYKDRKMPISSHSTVSAQAVVASPAQS